MHTKKESGLNRFLSLQLSDKQIAEIKGGENSSDIWIYIIIVEEIFD